MKLIICVDDNYGMLFNKRRLSQDRILRNKIIELCGNHQLWMNEYSAKQFENGIEEIVKLKEEYNTSLNIHNDLLDYINEEDYWFNENILIDEKIINHCNELILVKWNREYPSDVRFDKNYLNQFTLQSSIDFEGYSHECITIEVYKR